MPLLIEFSYTNRRSVKDRILFSAVAGEDHSHPKDLYSFGSFAVLKKAVIYGANGSGKTNLAEAVSFVQQLVNNSAENTEKIEQYPHKDLGDSVSSDFELQFISDETRYAFGFSLLKGAVAEEYLYCFPKGQETKIYERNAEGFSAGEAFEKALGPCKNELKPEKLLLSVAGKLCKIPEIASARKFFKEGLLICTSMTQKDYDKLLNYSLKAIAEDPVTKAQLLALLRASGLKLKDVRVVEPKEAENYGAKLVYKSFETDLLTEESVGVKKLIEFVCLFLGATKYGICLVCDELETHLHESVLTELLTLFSHLNTSGAQLVLIAQNLNLLRLSLFRKDEIWFVEMNGEDSSTKLYSLAEIRGIKANENIAKNYAKGKYGAIPLINGDFIAMLKQEVAE